MESRESAVAYCARTLRSSILSGDFAPGAQLPPERALATRLGVNRTTVRSALQQLAATGLLRVRQGSGYLVQDYRRSGGPDLLSGLVALATTTRSTEAELATELLFVRRHLARAVLERLAERTTEVDAGRIRRSAGAFREIALVGAEPPELAAADLHVLEDILAATKSPVLQLSMNPVLGVLASMPRLVAAMYAQPATNAAGYDALLGWLSKIPRPSLPIDAIMRDMAIRDEATLARIREEWA